MEHRGNNARAIGEKCHYCNILRIKTRMFTCMIFGQKQFYCSPLCRCYEMIDEGQTMKTMCAWDYLVEKFYEPNSFPVDVTRTHERQYELLVTDIIK